MKSMDDAAYAMAALSAAVVLFRALIKKGLLTREEAVRIILDEAVSQAIQAEAHDRREPGSAANRQCAEILKLIAEKL
jgi:glycerol dehydrogenase-like iron-containing ADH family enzyme